MKKLALALLPLWFALNSVTAQQGFTFNRITTEDGLGLASNVVYSIYQDPKGFIWAGTANGLQRFDGSKFIQFASGRNDRLVSAVTQIVPATNNDLWLSFPDRQEFGIFNTVSFHYSAVPIRVSRPITSRNETRIWKDSHGEVFVTVIGYGMLHYDRKKKVLTDDNFFGFPEGWIPSPWHFEDTLTHRYWFPCFNNGMAIYDDVSKKLYTKNYNPQHIPLLNSKKIVPNTSEVFIDSRRRHWIFNWPDGHMQHCFDSTGRELRDTAGLGYNPDYSETRLFYETRQGVLFMYGANSLYNYDRQQHRFFFYTHGTESETGIHFENVYQVMEDHDGSIWVATDNGLYFATPGSGTMNVVDMLFNDKAGKPEITDILELSSQRRWLSTWGLGVITMDRNMQRYNAHIYDDMPATSLLEKIYFRQVWALCQNRDGKVWMGCQAGRYIVYDTASKRSRFFSAPELGGSTVKYIAADAHGQMWFGTFQGTLARHDGRKMQVVQQFQATIFKIFFDKMGLMWVAVDNNGLFCLSADGKQILHHYTAYDPQNPLFSSTGADIEQLNDSTIVFGAGAMNFINFRTGKVRWLTFDDGLPGNTIQRIRIDENGYLWMITLNGLCRYNPVTRRVTTYGRKDGITLANFTKDADFACKDGTVMFAGSNALIYFQPGAFQDRRPPDVRITDFKLFNTFIPVDSLLDQPKVRLGTNQNSFSIYFAALSYLQREKLTYYYKMSGIDKDWVKGDRQNYINYSLLPPGNYTFSVYCENIDGDRSRNITELHIYIQPPFWRTFWFLSTLLFVIALIVYGLHRMRVNKLLAVEKLRIRVARDLHDDMGSTLSTINILSSMAKSRIQADPLKTSEYLGKISDNSQRMMDAMDDIVWSIKPSNDTMQKIVARMREFATNVLEAKEIELDFRIEDPVFDIKLNMEARRDFFLVFKEAVNNAAKYSKASMVTVHLTLHNNRLLLLVEDDGCGFDKEVADGNGLGNMQKRADAMHGRLQISSRPGEGTSVTLNIPVQ